MSTLDRTTGAWSDVPYNWDDPAEYIQPEGVDVFFSPLTFSKARRLNTLATPPAVLFADLDASDPHALSMKPHVAWETSQGSYQGLWLLDRPIRYLTKWANLNRRMTYYTDSDKGGWAASKVLRIPGSVNYKRGGQVGKVLWSDFSRPSYSVNMLNEDLPQVAHTESDEVGDAPEIIADRKQLDVIWGNLPPRIQWLLTRQRVSDRSRFIVSTGHEMHEAGVKLEDAYHMLWYAPYNKWRLRNNPQRLWTELHHIWSK